MSNIVRMLKAYVTVFFTELKHLFKVKYVLVLKCDVNSVFVARTYYTVDVIN